MKTIPQEAFELGIKHTSVYATFYRERKEVVPVMAQGEMVLVYDAGAPLFVAVPLVTMLSILKGSPTPPVTQTPPKPTPTSQTPPKQEQSQIRESSLKAMQEEAKRRIQAAIDRSPNGNSPPTYEEFRAERPPLPANPTYEEFRAERLKEFGDEFCEEMCREDYEGRYGDPTHS